MKLTKHAEKRKNQRGFSRFTLDIIENFGHMERAPGGATKIFLGKRDCLKAAQELKRVIQILDKAKGGNLIISEGAIITVYKS